MIKKKYDCVGVIKTGDKERVIISLEISWEETWG
jgi:hypothetical protein